MSGMEEKRKFTRVNVNFQVSVKSGANPSIKGTSRDISMGGLIVETGDSLPVGSECDVTVHLSSGTEPVEIQCRGKVNRPGLGGMAVEFSGIDLDSGYHLRRLVLYDSADPDRIERELGEHTVI